MSYGIDPTDLFRHAASYVDRVLKGANPADFPIQNPTKFELVINLKTAKALWADNPESFLARADEVIEYDLSTRSEVFAAPCWMTVMGAKPGSS